MCRQNSNFSHRKHSKVRICFCGLKKVKVNIIFLLEPQNTKELSTGKFNSNLILSKIRNFESVGFCGGREAGECSYKFTNWVEPFHREVVSFLVNFQHLHVMKIRFIGIFPPFIALYILPTEKTKRNS